MRSRGQWMAVALRLWQAGEDWDVEKYEELGIQHG